jgi:Photosynthesis system II assembly factor YCF48
VPKKHLKTGLQPLRVLETWELKMENIPNIANIVRERLKAASPVVDHPDANVLTAFAEKSLPAIERTAIVEHLARCADCRDIVALALPPTEAAEPVVVPTRTRWLTWPTLRWGFVVGGIVAVASVGVLQYQQRSHEARFVLQAPTSVLDTEARNESPAPSSVPAPSSMAKKTVAPADTLSAAPTNALTIPPESVPPSEQQKPSRQQLQFNDSLARKTTTGKAMAHGPFTPYQQQAIVQQAPAPMAPNTFARQQYADAPAATPSTSMAVEVQGAAPQVMAEDQNHEAKVLDQSADDQRNYSKAKAPVMVANAPPPAASAEPGVQTQTASTKNIPINGRNFTQFAALSLLPTPLWTISPTGALQRSTDQGNTWQDVEVNAAPSQFAGAMSSVVVMKAARAKEEADKKSLKRDSSSPVFRVVTAAGVEVWAGGNNAALYHSVDAGAHWTRVQPSLAGAVLTGDILTLEFPDPQHGRITTSTSEVWTTADAGQTWQKQ